MAEYLSPGVFIQEKNTGQVPMQGVSTATLCVAGWFERGPVNEMTFLSSSSELSRLFGGVKSYLNTDEGYEGVACEYYKAPMAILGYFANGGTRVYVLRIPGAGASIAEVVVPGYPSGTAWHVKAISPGFWGNRVKVAYQQNEDQTGWYVSVYFKELPSDADYLLVEQYSDVNFEDPNSQNYVTAVINDASNYIEFVQEGGDIGGRPYGDEVAGDSLTGGFDGTRVTPLTASNLENIDQVQEMMLLIAPDDCGTAQQANTDKALITYCEAGSGSKRTDCFAVLTTPKGKTPQEAIAYASTTLNKNTSRAALYYPWVKVINPVSLATDVFPPIGHIAGVYARTDITRNVAKAPAGVTDGALSGIVGVERTLTKAERDAVYPYKVNPLINESYTGTAVWGVRTLSMDPLWRYINFRRAFQYFEKTTFENTHWVVFEPNTATTRQKVKMQLDAFLLTHFYEGYFAGKSPTESYYVICDESNNPEESVAQGLLYIDVGLAIARPAEFVVFRFAQKTLKG